MAYTGKSPIRRYLGASRLREVFLEEALHEKEAVEKGPRQVRLVEVDTLQAKAWASALKPIDAVRGRLGEGEDEFTFLAYHGTMCSIGVRTHMRHPFSGTPSL